MEFAYPMTEAPLTSVALLNSLPIVSPMSKRHVGDGTPDLDLLEGGLCRSSADPSTVRYVGFCICARGGGSDGECAECVQRSHVLFVLPCRAVPDAWAKHWVQKADSTF